METGWLKAKVIVTKDDIGEPKILRDSGLPNDTQVIAIVPSNTFHTNINSEWVWRVCVNTATLISVKMVGSGNLPVPASPLELSTGSLSLSNDLSLYVPETVRLQHHFKNREVIWIQPIKSHPVQEVWLRASHYCSEHSIQQFLDQIHQRSTKSKIIVKMNAMLHFNLSSGSHDATEMWFDVLQVLPIAQGNLTEDTRIIIVPASDDTPSLPRNSDDESDSDVGLTYDPHGRIIKDYSSGSETEDEDSYSQGLLPVPKPRQPLESASEIRRSSVVTISDNMHLFKCIPLYNFPVEKNFILLPPAVRERLGCYGLENLVISPCGDLHADQSTSFVAIVEEFREKIGSRSTVYVHPEVYFYLFPFPVDHVSTRNQIKAEV